MNFFFMYGNVGTHKSTYARYISDTYSTLILDDDELYYALSNKSWRFYYNQHTQDTVMAMMKGALAMLHDNQHKDVVVASASITPQEFTKMVGLKSRPFFIVTGNGTREFSLENRRKNSRGGSPEAWAKLYDQQAAKIKDNMQFNSYKILEERVDATPENPYGKQMLVLKNPLDEELSKKEIDNFMKDVYNL